MISVVGGIGLTRSCGSGSQNGMIYPNKIMWVTQQHRRNSLLLLMVQVPLLLLLRRFPSKSGLQAKDAKRIFGG